MVYACVVICPCFVILIITLSNFILKSNLTRIPYLLIGCILVIYVDDNQQVSVNRIFVFFLHVINFITSFGTCKKICGTETDENRNGMIKNRECLIELNGRTSGK